MLLWAPEHVPAPLFQVTYLCISHAVTWELQLPHLKTGGMLSFQLPLPMSIQCGLLTCEIHPPAKFLPKPTYKPVMCKLSQPTYPCNKYIVKHPRGGLRMTKMQQTGTSL